MRLVSRGRLVSAAIVLLFATSAPLAAAQDVEAEFFPNACRDVLAEDAMAYGRATPILVKLNGETVLSVMDEEDDEPYAEARQEGPGKAGDRIAFVDVSVPNEEDPIVTAQLLHGRVDLDVDDEPAGLEAEAWVNTRVAHLNVLDGLITADLVRAFAYARSDVRSASTHTDASTIVGLQVAGVSYTDIAPGANLTLPTLVGPGSYVTVYERIDQSRRPTEDVPFYIADVQVRMLHIYLSNVPLLGEVEIIVSDSYARAETPTPFCGIAQSVEAAGYIARVRPLLDNDPDDGSHGLLVGEQHIGVTGGSGHQQLLGQDLNLEGAVRVLVNVTETDVVGNIDPGIESKADAMTQVLGICIKVGDTDGDECFVEAVLVRAEAHCLATEEGASCEGKTTILKLVVAGVNVCAALGQDEGGTCEPEPNTKQNVGPIRIILNEQERVDDPGGYASLYVRAVRIETGLPLVGTIIISRAYASAGFEEAGTNDETPAWDL